jgi:hypothetical protein
VSTLLSRLAAPYSPTGISNNLASISLSLLSSPDWRVHQNRPVHCHLRPHTPPKTNTQTSSHNWRRRAGYRQRKRHTYSPLHTHERTHAHTHNHTIAIAIALSLRPPASRPLVSVAVLRAHFVFSRRIPAPCSHPSTTRITAVVSSHTEATHWRCTGLGRMLSTRRWADPETTNTAHSFTSPFTRSPKASRNIEPTTPLHRT